jgi:alpha/beta superfamily hydrolase
MHSPVVLALAKVLAEAGHAPVATLRFNFRGVPSSEGTYDDGRGETEDVRAAIDELRRRAPGAKLTVCGHSFGSWTGLRASGLDGGIERVALVAPSTRFFEFNEGDGARVRQTPDVGKLAIFIGDQDEFSTVEEAQALAETLGAEITVLEGNDHHFLKSRRKMADVVVPFIAPEARNV